MKTIHKFSKAFLGCAIFSAIVIAFGIVGVCVRHINFGIDFEPGLIEEVRVAPTAIEVTYSGAATVNMEMSATGIDVVISGTGAENETRTFTFGQNPTVEAIVASLNSVEDIHAVLRKSGSADSYGLFTNSAATSRLSSDVPYRLYVQSQDLVVTVDDIREAVKDLGVNVKPLGTEENRSFQIRAKAAEDDTNQKLQENITNALQNAFGNDNVAIIKTDFVGSTFSKSLMLKSILLALLTVVLIWLYATVRFHWDFALGAIVALIHDFLIMFTFISWFQIEFSSTTLAAVLTIFGYSINATVVILDRVRSNMKIMTEAKKFNEILDKSLTDTLSRSIITTVTTLFASIALWVFTDGAIKTFAIVLTIGLISGCYSSLFISSGFISMVRRNWENGENAERVAPRKETAHRD